MNITGTLPEAGNFKLIITRPLPEKTCAAIEGVYTKADRKLSTRDPRIVQSLNYGYICMKRTPRYNVVRDVLQQSCYTAG